MSNMPAGATEKQYEESVGLGVYCPICQCHDCGIEHCDKCGETPCVCAIAARIAARTSIFIVNARRTK